jgi:hypothetical protein
MKEMRILARVALLALACVIPAMAADDLPHFEGRFKTSVFSVEGDADYVLSGINLYRTTISETIARFGNPIRVRVAARKGKLAGGRDYEWKRGDVEIRVGTCYGHGVEELLCSVEVRGKKPVEENAVSARGMRLGASMAEVRRLYFSSRRLLSAPSAMPDDDEALVTVKWPDGTTLYLHFADGRVNHMILSSSCIPFSCSDWY